MKLLFITQDFPPDIGGIQTYSYEIARRIYQYCDEFIVVAPDKPDAGKVDKELPFEVIRIRSTNPMLGYLCVPRVLRLLKKRQIDVVFHAQWQTLLVSRMAKKRGLVKKVAAAAHARELFFNPMGNGFLGKQQLKLQQKLINSADHFLPVSEYTSDALGGWGVAAEHRTVVINGTDPNSFFPLDQNEIKEKYGYQGKKVLVTISRLVERKGVDTVIQAMPQLIAKDKDIRYVVVGAGGYGEYLKSLVEELNLGDYVHFTGKVPYAQLNEYYNLGDIFVMPSKSRLPDVEGFGIVFLEANACGKAVIGARTGGIPSAIVDGETGLMVEEKNPDELAAAVQRLLDDESLREQMGTNGRQRVETEANWDAVSAKLFGVLKGLLTEK